jgi:hypothetical protein
LIENIFMNPKQLSWVPVVPSRVLLGREHTQTKNQHYTISR